MRWSAVSVGIAILICGNLSSSLSDVAVKLLDGSVSAFQYMFIRQLLSVILIAPLWLRLTPAQRDIGHWKINAIRAHLVLAGSGMLLIALTYLPLATANALFYAAPLLMLPLSMVVLGERPNKEKVLATAVGFIGIIIVLRPDQFHWAALAALGTASTLALYNVLVRKLPPQQPIISTLFWTGILSLPISSLLAYQYWQPLQPKQWLLIAASAVFTLGYQGCCVAAYRQSETYNIGLAEYSGLIFVAILGYLWFDEIPDLLTGLGILLIIIPMAPWPKIRHSKNALTHNAD